MFISHHYSSLTVGFMQLSFCLCSVSCHIISIICLQMNDIVDASQSSTFELQEQIDLYKEKNRRELTELQKLLKERGQELEKHLLMSKTLQEEVPRSPISPVEYNHYIFECWDWWGQIHTIISHPRPPMHTADDELLFKLNQFNSLPLPSSAFFQKCHHLGIFYPSLPNTEAEHLCSLLK